MDKRFPRALVLCTLSLLFCGCEQDTQPKSEPQSQALTAYVEDAQASQELWARGQNVLNDAVISVQALQSSIDQLLSAPSEQTLTAARGSWQQAELAYSSFYFFNQFAVTEPEIFAPLAKAHFAIAAQPIQPGYLDYFGPYQYSGLVHDISVKLNKESLQNQHGLTDAEDVVLGLYAIKFMLFGEASQRPVSDYIPASALSPEQQELGFTSVEETPIFRRRKLLMLQAELLTQTCQQLATIWQAREAGSLYDRWQSLPDSAHRDTIRKTFERAITRLLLDAATLSPSANNSADHEPENTPAKAQTSPQIISIGIESLQAALPWLEPKARASIKSNLLDAQQQLTQLEGTTIDWRAVYQALKAAIDAFHTTINPANSADK